jgi:hypothetical protein
VCAKGTRKPKRAKVGSNAQGVGTHAKADSSDVPFPRFIKLYLFKNHITPLLLFQTVMK